MNKYLITVITVVKNCELGIEKTVLSVLSQDFADFEYVIIDGKSSDNTLDILNKYRSDSRIRIYSEQDGGIYDAMNKGAGYASGEYLYFLNAGDYFVNEQVLSKFADISCLMDTDIYYGNILLKKVISKHPKRLTKLWLIYEERMISHQSIFAKRSLFDEYEFDTNYKICADRDWLIHHFLNGASIECVSDYVIAFFDEDGVSSYYDEFSVENLDISRKYGGNLAVLMVLIKRKIGEMVGHKRKWRNI